MKQQHEDRMTYNLTYTEQGKQMFNEIMALTKAFKKVKKVSNVNFDVIEIDNLI